MGFKENLKSELEYQGVLLKELAAKTGINLYTLNNYLYGHNSLPNVESAVKIAQALGVSVEYLVTGKSELPRSKPLPAKIKNLAADIETLDSFDQASLKVLISSMKKRPQNLAGA